MSKRFSHRDEYFCDWERTRRSCKGSKVSRTHESAKFLKTSLVCVKTSSRWSMCVLAICWTVINDMDKEESDLIETRKRIEEAEEKIAANAQEAAKISFQMSMDAKKIQKRCSFN